MATKSTKSTSATATAPKATNPAAEEGDVDIVDVGTDTGTEVAPVDQTPHVPAVFKDNFDEEMQPAWVPLPSATLVHGVGEYKNTFNPGQFVMGSLERAAELTLGAKSKYKTPDDILNKGSFKCIVIAVSAPVWQPDVKPEHPQFKLEIPTEPNSGHLAKIEALNGTVDPSKKMIKQLFVPKSELLLLIEKPSHVSADFDDMFPEVLDGKRYALARHFAKKTGFTNFVEPLRTQRKINPKLREVKNPDGSVTRPNWYTTVFAVGATLVTSKNNPSGFFVPEITPLPDAVGPEAAAFCASADPVQRNK